jgi:hypothetical protein
MPETSAVNPAPLRVFLSHTSELAAYPLGRSFFAGAEEGVKRAEAVVIDMAYFTARDDKCAAYCREKVQQAQVYVGVLGFRYGSLVRDRPELSYTELEFDTATELGIPRLVFAVDDEPHVILPLGFFRDDVHDPDGSRQAAFRARVKESGLTIQKTHSPAELTTLVLQALQELRARTQERVGGGIGRERVPGEPVPVRSSRFVNPAPVAAPSWFQDRVVETRLLGRDVADPGVRMVTVAGRGGIGKTAMVCRLLKGLEEGRVPDIAGDGGQP